MHLLNEKLQFFNYGDPTCQVASSNRDWLRLKGVEQGSNIEPAKNHSTHHYHLLYHPSDNRISVTLIYSSSVCVASLDCASNNYGKSVSQESSSLRNNWYYYPKCSALVSWKMSKAAWKEWDERYPCDTPGVRVSWRCQTAYVYFSAYRFMNQTLPFNLWHIAFSTNVPMAWDLNIHIIKGLLFNDSRMSLHTCSVYWNRK